MNKYYENKEEIFDSVELEDEENEEGKYWAPCPYSSEISGDETLCYCSDAKRHECAMEI